MSLDKDSPKTGPTDASETWFSRLKLPDFNGFLSPIIMICCIAELTVFQIPFSDPKVYVPVVCSIFAFFLDPGALSSSSAKEVTQIVDNEEGGES
ncbi:hypothetical protein JW962_00855 [Candidatus Dojkabacteria bacterium]|nr:hypothetical protein [Candidatus Dojkabacteria bacterium]